MKKSRIILKVLTWVIVGIVASLLVVFALNYSKFRYSNEQLMVELNQHYQGYYLNEKWVSKSNSSEADKSALRKRWEKHGYHFIQSGNDIVVSTKESRVIAIIKNAQSVEFK